MTEPAKPTLMERMAQAHYERAWEGVIGCCEEPWDKLPADYRDRLCDAQRAALAVVMAEMREPSAKMIDAARSAEYEHFFAKKRPNEHAWMTTPVMLLAKHYRAMLAVFEAENA